MMISEERFGEIRDRVMRTAIAAGVKEFEEDLALLMIELKRGRKAELQVEELRGALENVILFIEPTVGEKCTPAHLVAYKDATDALAKSKGHQTNEQAVEQYFCDKCGVSHKKQKAKTNEPRLGREPLDFRAEETKD